MAYKGKYTPKHPEKYIGDVKKIIYRSLWERKFMVYCDTNVNVLEWGSEELAIPYISPVDNRHHRYYPDFWIKVRNKNNRTEVILIEVKPKKQLKPPAKPQHRVSKRYLMEAQTYAVNQAKFKAAESYCKDRRYKFRILTEDHLT